MASRKLNITTGITKLKASASENDHCLSHWVVCYNGMWLTTVWVSKYAITSEHVCGKYTAQPRGFRLE